MPVVRGASPLDVDLAAAILAEAFHHDPTTRWVVADDGQRMKSLRAFFLASLTHDWMTAALVDVVGDPVEAVAVWIPHSVAAPHADNVELERAVARAWGPHLPRAQTIFALMDSYRPSDPHWYLVFMGTRPSAQGRGLGSALLRHGLRRSDRSGVGSFLEASAPSNLKLYARFGFETTSEICLPQGPTFWAMRRPAAPPGVNERWRRGDGPAAGG